MTKSDQVAGIIRIPVVDGDKQLDFKFMVTADTTEEVTRIAQLFVAAMRDPETDIVLSLPKGAWHYGSSV